MKVKVRAMVVILVVVVVAATMPPTIEGAYCPPPPRCGSCGPKGKPTPSPHRSPPKSKTPPASGGSPGGKPPAVKPAPPVVKPTPPYTPTPVTPVTPSPVTPPPSSNTCPKDALKLGACVDLLGGIVHIGVGDPAVNQCCPLLQGLAALEAALCLCTAINVKLLNLNVYLPLALQLLASCDQNPPVGFTCPSRT